MTDSRFDQPLRVLQLTDPHLMADEQGSLLGVNTRDSLNAVIDEVLSAHGRPDLVLATGDITQDASEAAYRYFGERLNVFGCPSLWIAGNHDDAAVQASIASEFQAGQKQMVRGGWHFVMLDSSVPGKVYGELAESELAFLQKALAEHPDLPTMVCLHHHPVSIGSAWMDRIGLIDPGPFWRVVDRQRQVKVVLWGHIHQDFHQQRNGVQLLASPSTCIQFAAGSEGFAVEPAAPGYRWFELHASGDLQTSVGRATGFEFDLDEQSGGY
ncbi:Icc protein [Marinobacter persicus]|uniref:Icc protein n=1 Tax=Marinobacter persicus TaxID=930118 RepID=A0A1I3X700_9GAMM|nr:3',5'-cyclic-AMP phosphodiesterase [Marinobacter persicus]KXS54543.1 MAG: Icc protein [Marinobacter sp. T13-3]GHD48804.1 3',5'-cyclic adenosine monophosphate phosphodiesterase CpdA [Marinobacter persicus]SFK15552.1 Icc protein [Marinobacter persicus]